MQAAVVHEFKAPFCLEEVAKPEPGPEQIVVKIEASGLCHTDIHAAHGDWPVKPKLPFIPGHEGVGIVEMVGPGVTGVKEGDRVAIFGIGGLGHLAVQYAKIAGATVVAVDLVDEKLEMAKKLGADYTVNGKAEDPVEASKKLGGADAVVCVAVGA